MTKKTLFTIRTDPKFREDVKKAAERKGTTMSGLIYDFLKTVVKEDKEKQLDLV